MKITDEIGYKTAIERLEFLEGLVTDETPSTDSNYIELDALIDAIDVYEEEVYPIAKPTSILIQNEITNTYKYARD